MAKRVSPVFYYATKEIINEFERPNDEQVNACDLFERMDSLFELIVKLLKTKQVGAQQAIYTADILEMFEANSNAGVLENVLGKLTYVIIIPY